MIEIAMAESYLDLDQPSADFYEIKHRQKVLSLQSINPRKFSYKTHSLKLNRILHSKFAPLNLQQEELMLTLGQQSLELFERDD